MFAILFAQRDNRIFWDGSNWNRIATKLGEGSKSVSQIKAAHLNGILAVSYTHLTLPTKA